MMNSVLCIQAKSIMGKNLREREGGVWMDREGGLMGRNKQIFMNM